MLDIGRGARAGSQSRDEGESAVHFCFGLLFLRTRGAVSNRGSLVRERARNKAAGEQNDTNE